MNQKTTSRRTFMKSSLGTASLAGVSSLTATPGQSAPKKQAWEPKISERTSNLSESRLRWMAQLGFKHVVFQGRSGIDLDDKGYWSVEDIGIAQKKCEAYGMELASLIIPINWYRKNSLGEPGRDEEIDRIVRSVKAAGETGISMLEWRPTWLDFYWDERVGFGTEVGRGGAIYSNFDYDRVKELPPFDEFPPVSTEEMWERMLYLGRPVVEAAEKAGTVLSMHPNDPPVPVMRGAPRIFTSMADAERLIKEFPSPAFGITFCQGTFAETGENIPDAIRRLGSRIHHVHLRGVRGTVPKYTEVFIDESDQDMFEAMKAYKEIGYTRTIVSDHSPKIDGDTPDRRMGYSYSHGYIRAMMQAVNAVT